MKQRNTARAEMVAAKVHNGQTYDIYPYMKHIKDVVHIAEQLGYDESIQIACYLHDSMEDGNLSFNDIKTHFGKEVAEIVFSVTDELGRNRKERHEKTYPKIRANEKAVCVKLCDRIANIQNSMEFGTGQYEMYKKESDAFRSALYSEHHLEAERAWKLLASLFN